MAGLPKKPQLLAQRRGAWHLCSSAIVFLFSCPSFSDRFGKSNELNPLGFEEEDGKGEITSNLGFSFPLE